MESDLDTADSVDPTQVLIAADAQTSGGLLLCLDPDVAAKAVADLEADGHQAADVGVLEAPTADKPIGRIALRP
jgi:selenide,water dikinase